MMPYYKDILNNLSIVNYLSRQDVTRNHRIYIQNKLNDMEENNLKALKILLFFRKIAISYFKLKIGKDVLA